MNNTNIENGIYFIYDGGVWLNKCINGCGEVFSGMYFINLEQSKVKVTKSIGEYFEGNYGSIVLEILEESKDIVNVKIEKSQFDTVADDLKGYLWDELEGTLVFPLDDETRCISYGKWAYGFYCLEFDDAQLILGKANKNKGDLGK